MRLTRWYAALSLFLLLLPVLSSCQSSDPVLVVSVYDGLNGRSLRGARCTLPKDQARTDDGGLCRLQRWKEGDTLYVAAPGYQDAEAVLQGLVPDGEPPEARMAVALYPDHVWGTVTDRYTGAPVGGADVRMGAQSTSSGADGEFVLRNPTFPFTLTVQAPGYALWSGSFVTTTVTIAIRPNTIEGSVRDQFSDRPLPGATVAVLVTPPFTTTTDAAGHYRLTDLPEQFRLRIRAPGYR
ncbi:MAG: carboxypeptidase-like regulatory domain-containing protein, partial [Chloroflexia bacterium]